MRRSKKQMMIWLVMLSLSFLSGCSLPGLPSSDSPNTIAIGMQNTTESQILGGMIKGMVEYYTELDVNMISNLGTSTMLHQAMLRGDVEISASRYTGTDLSGALRLPPEKDPARALEIVQREFKEQFQQTWFDSYGFANTYAFMVSKATAEKYNLSKISDLKEQAANLTAGVDPSWLDRKGDGYKGFTADYGFDFGKVYPMQIGLVYDAVNAGKMDVVLGYSTDGRIASYDLVILEDDRHYFPPYDCSLLVSDKVLAAHPELKEVLAKLTQQVDTATMQRLNYEADDKLVEPEVVAKRFLQEQGYFKEGEEATK